MCLLNTMTMGDINAVEFGQPAHVLLAHTDLVLHDKSVLKQGK